ncbi:hypothetical protein [Caniella muris]|uniref:hypothetical protein n=1 Tax=Caniella muris TaxID=2941502 RepID=UPI002041CCBF|nr:hypothetical protein [Caniella muris]
MTGTETRERPWTAREDAVVRCCAGLHDAAWEGWGHILPGRGAEEVAERIPEVLAAAPGSPAARRRRSYHRSGRPWDPGEVDALRACADRAGATLAEVLEAVPGRSPRSVRAKAAALGIPVPCAREPWSAEEDARLKEHYPAHGSVWVGWRRILPGRGASAIEARSRELAVPRGPRAGRWTDREVEILSMYWDKKGAAWEGWGRLLPGRTELAIRARAKRLGPKAGGGRPRPWTEGEIGRLKERYPAHGPSWDGWARVLPGRAPAAIAAMARRLRVTPPGGPATAHGAS